MDASGLVVRVENGGQIPVVEVVTRHHSEGVVEAEYILPITVSYGSGQVAHTVGGEQTDTVAWVGLGAILAGRIGTHVCFATVGEGVSLSVLISAPRTDGSRHIEGTDPRGDGPIPAFRVGNRIGDGNPVPVVRPCAADTDLGTDTTVQARGLVHCSSLLSN